jgi:hypothetical protein
MHVMDTLATKPSFHPAGEPGFGLPQDRLARMAARQAFVELKTSFMQAAADIEGSLGDRLQHQLRQADEVTDLWRLRQAVMDGLPRGRAETQQHHAELQRQLDEALPPGGTAFAPL